MDRRRASTLLSTRLFNPLVKTATNAGLPVPGIAILETTGRKPAGCDARPSDVRSAATHSGSWLSTVRNANYVRNLQVNPSVRIKIGRRWRTWNRRTMPDDDPRARQRAMPAANAAVVRLMGTDLFTVRVDLDPERRD